MSFVKTVTAVTYLVSCASTLCLFGQDVGFTGTNQEGIPDFGPNVLVFDPSMTNIQSRLDAIFREQDSLRLGWPPRWRFTKKYRPSLGFARIHSDFPSWPIVNDDFSVGRRPWASAGALVTVAVRRLGNGAFMGCSPPRAYWAVN